MRESERVWACVCTLVCAVFAHWCVRCLRARVDVGAPLSLLANKKQTNLMGNLMQNDSQRCAETKGGAGSKRRSNRQPILQCRSMSKQGPKHKQRRGGGWGWGEETREGTGRW